MARVSLAARGEGAGLDAAMACVSSGQICWVKTSDDTAALTGGASWWPGVVFQSWEDLDGWELPVAPADDREEVKSDEARARVCGEIMRPGETIRPPRRSSRACSRTTGSSSSTRRPCSAPGRRSVSKSNLQPDFNVRVCDRFDARFSAVLRELDESNRFVQKSAESTSI